jgi:hypothetical protein
MLGWGDEDTAMRKLAIPFSVLAVGATALLMVPAIAPAGAKTAGQHVHHRHMNKHASHWRPHYGRAWYGYPAAPMVRSYGGSGDVCPAMGRSFDCKIWPPPFADDPDRRVPGRL